MDTKCMRASLLHPRRAIGLIQLSIRSRNWQMVKVWYIIELKEHCCDGTGWLLTEQGAHHCLWLQLLVFEQQ